MQPNKKSTKITEFFLKFMLTQITILTTFQQFMRIINHLHTDLHYEIVGPYMLKTSMIPHNQGCHKFYDPNKALVQFYGQSYTHDQYMKKLQTIIQQQYVLFEVTMVGLTLLLSLIIQLIGFVWDDNILIVLDNIFTLLLPHFSLYVNTISWGDLCIQESPIFNILQFTIVGRIGLFTISLLVILLLMFVFLIGCNISMGSPLIFIYGCLLCLFFCYTVTIDVINIYSSIYIIRVLTVAKFVLMGFQLYTVYSK